MQPWCDIICVLIYLSHKRCSVIIKTWLLWIIIYLKCVINGCLCMTRRKFYCWFTPNSLFPGNLWFLIVKYKLNIFLRIDLEDLCSENALICFSVNFIFCYGRYVKFGSDNCAVIPGNGPFREPILILILIKRKWKDLIADLNNKLSSR